MNQYKTEEESFWAGEFGNNYISRNSGAEIIAANTAFFAKILNRTSNVSSIIEFGSNIGLNLLAIKNLLPNANLSAIEINTKAVEHLKKIDNLKVYSQSILDFTPTIQNDLVFIKGVLIHINPEQLQTVYQKLYDSSDDYICVAEYYSPSPVELSYRGHKEKLYKRDFAGEILDKFDDLELIDYGFSYHRDPTFMQGDITWFLLKKR